MGKRTASKKTGRPEPILYEEVFRALQRHRVKYLVAGGVAVNLHGFHRFTSDLDLMLRLNESNIEKFIKAVKVLGFRPRIPVPLEDFADEANRKRWRKEKGALVLGLDNPKNPIERIDVFLENPIDFESAYKRRQALSVRGVIISLTALDDLVTLKKLAARPVDKADIEVLKRLSYRKNKE